MQARASESPTNYAQGFPYDLETDVGCQINVERFIIAVPFYR